MGVCGGSVVLGRDGRREGVLCRIGKEGGAVADFFVRRLGLVVVVVVFSQMGGKKALGFEQGWDMRR